MSRALAFGLATALFASPVYAQHFDDSIARAATQAATAAAQDAARPTLQPRGRIPRGFLWTGVGLLAAGGLYFGVAAAAGDEQACVSIGSRSNGDCISVRKVGLITGSILAGTGGSLIAVGVAKSHNAPSISFGPAGVVVQQKLPLRSKFWTERSRVSREER